MGADVEVAAEAAAAEGAKTSKESGRVGVLH
jgi:hypothetical protein